MNLASLNIQVKTLQQFCLEADEPRDDHRTWTDTDAGFATGGALEKEHEAKGWVSVTNKEELVRAAWEAASQN